MRYSRRLFRTCTETAVFAGYKVKEWNQKASNCFYCLYYGIEKDLRHQQPLCQIHPRLKLGARLSFFEFLGDFFIKNATLDLHPCSTCLNMHHINFQKINHCTQLGIQSLQFSGFRNLRFFLHEQIKLISQSNGRLDK